MGTGARHHADLVQQLILYYLISELVRVLQQNYTCTTQHGFGDDARPLLTLTAVCRLARGWHGQPARPPVRGARCHTFDDQIDKIRDKILISYLSYL